MFFVIIKFTAIPYNSEPTMWSSYWCSLASGKYDTQAGMEQGGSGFDHCGTL